MDRIKFGIIGGGWRGRFSLRIAEAVPEKFEVVGLVDPNAEIAEEVSGKWGIRTFTTLDQMLSTAKPEFILTAIPRNENPSVMDELALREIPILTEVPPAPDMEGLLRAYDSLKQKKAKVQVAEQYIFQPEQAARLSVAASGKMGPITQAQISVGHGYHGISVMRRFLGIKFKNANIQALKFCYRVVGGFTREGPREKEELLQTEQQFVWFDFGDRLGLIDFDTEQYMSRFLSDRVLIRGERGEIVNNDIVFLKDFRTPIKAEFLRHSTGIGANLQGNFLEGIQLGQEWVYVNPFAPAAFSDEEIAVGTSLLKMGQYVREGVEFYSLAEACQDHYLNLLALKALAEGKPAQSQTQPWAQ
jgi:hypothetical protein